MQVPCRQVVDPKSCLYRCRVSGNIDPDCFNCIVYECFEDNDKTIKALKKEALVYRLRYDEMVKSYAKHILESVPILIAHLNKE